MNAKKILFPLRLIISAGLLAFLYRRVDPAEFIAVFADVRILPLILLFVLLFLNTAISALKWKWLLAADEIELPLKSLIASYLVGTFFNMFLPSNIGGDAYRVYDIARHSRRTAHSFASVLADRLSGFVALVMIGFAFGLLGLKLLPDPDVLWIPPLVMLALAFIIGALLQQRLLRWIMGWPVFDRLGKIRGFAFGLLDSVQQYRRAPRLFSRIMGLSFLFQFSVIVCIYLLSEALKLDIPFVYLCVIVPFVLLVEALPISIYGLGIRDATYVFFFTRMELPEVHGLTLALAYVLATLLYSLSGGVIFLVRPVMTQRHRAQGKGSNG